MSQKVRRESESSASEFFMVPKKSNSGGPKRASLVKVGTEQEHCKNNKTKLLRGENSVLGGGGSSESSRSRLKTKSMVLPDNTPRK